jgi:hypothetical protein
MRKYRLGPHQGLQVETPKEIGMNARSNIYRLAIFGLLLARSPRWAQHVLAWMALGVLLTVLFVALSVAAPRTAEGLLPEYKPWDFPPELDLGEWSCGVFTVHRTQQKEQPRLYWEVFRVAVGARTGPRKIVLTYDANTDRLTLNGKRCREVKD